MIVFDYEPNWRHELTAEFAFMTIIQASRLLKEQRKPLLATMKRSLECTFDIPQDAFRLFNVLQAGQAVPFYVPWFTEPILPTGTGNLKGLTNIPVTDFVSNYCTRNLAADFMLIDVSGAERGEIKTKASFTGTTQITFTQNVAGTFPAASTVIYPVFYATCTGKKLRAATDSYLQYALTFEEYF